MSKPLHILFVEDSLDDVKLLLIELRQGGYAPVYKQVQTAEDMRDALACGECEIVISDYRMPGFSGLDALAIVKETGQDIPFIIVSGTIGEVAAVEAMRAGAHDYVMKDNLTRLAPAIQRELQEASERKSRRLAEAENERLLAEKAATVLAQRAFLKDVLYSVTEGKLTLCDSHEALPEMFAIAGNPAPVTRESLSEVRRKSLNACAEMSLAEERGHDLITAVGEACMNAVVHGGGGEARVCVGDDRIQVWIEDHGRGIEIGTLPKAMLERGFTTANSFGHGFFLMLSLVDRLYLLTGPKGTTIVLEQFLTPPEPIWLQGLPMDLAA
ncbi:MAG TPA: response regulator [Capsulimonadaceae bacterium]|nr:response regulator [Capsulimonadaceae bacterium]